MSDPLPLGEVESLALRFESYQLAFTPGLAQQIYIASGKLTQVALNQILADEGHYVHSEGDNNWWIPSGRVFFSPNETDSPALELIYARTHFFLPHRFEDPFGANSTVHYDEPHNLLLLESEDALQNKMTVGERDGQGNIINGNDYRVLQPQQVTDPNGNRTHVAFDTLGMVVGTAVMGKRPPAPVEGDSLIGFVADQTENAIQNHIQDPLADPHAILAQATTRLVYDVH
ncbi:MAG: hypothetical protein GY809_08145, partial [Planctomycetes bacterium]|nr:hypothetical protein [Planctomycetota bacterium]